MMIDLANSIEKLHRKFRLSREFSTNHDRVAALFIFEAAHPTLLQAEEKRARNPVPKCPSKLLEPAIGQSAG